MQRRKTWLIRFPSGLAHPAHRAAVLLGHRSHLVQGVVSVVGWVGQENRLVSNFGKFSAVAIIHFHT